MVVKKSKATKGARAKLGKLKLNKETVKSLTTKETKAVKGGQAYVRPADTLRDCPSKACNG